LYGRVFGQCGDSAEVGYDVHDGLRDGALHQTRRHVTRTHVDERRDSIGRHPFERLREPDGLDELLTELPGRVRDRFGRRVGVDRERRSVECDLLERLVEPVGGRFHVRGVEGAGDRQGNSASDSQLSGVGRDPFDVRPGPRDHDLGRSVHVGYPEPSSVAPTIGNDPLGLLGIAADQCRHTGRLACGGCIRHGSSPFGHETQAVLVGQRTRCSQCRVLTERVPRRGGRRAGEGFLERRPERIGDSEESWLGMFGPGQVILGALEHEPLERPAEHRVCAFSEQSRIHVEQVGPHPHLLAPLAGEEDGVCSHRSLLCCDSMYRPRPYHRGFKRSLDAAVSGASPRRGDPRRYFPGPS